VATGHPAPAHLPATAHVRATAHVPAASPVAAAAAMRPGHDRADGADGERERSRDADHCLAKHDVFS